MGIRYNLKSWENKSERNKIIKEITLKLNKPATFLASFPRSGSMWLRSLLFDYNALCEGKNISPLNPPNGLQFFSPHFELDDFYYKFDNHKFVKKIIKTHLPLYFFETILQNKKVVMLFRNPADCFVSAFEKRTSPGYKKAGANPDELVKFQNKLIQTGINNFSINHASLWDNYAQSFISLYDEKNVEILFVSYENLTKNTKLTLKKALCFLGEDIVEQFVKKVISNRKIKIVKKHPRDEYAKIDVNRGKLEHSKKILSEHTLHLIEKKTQHTYNKLRLIEKEQ